MLSSAAPAWAESHTVTFKPSEGSATFTVPAGVTGVEVLAIGGAGQEGGSCSTAPGGKGGAGAKVSAAVDTGALSALYVEFGGGGEGGKAFSCKAGAGGEGGGVSIVREESIAGELLVVAGGGGGGGGAGSSSSSNHGGAGGSTEGKNGHSGESGLFEGGARGKGGEGATQAAAGKKTGSGKNAGAEGSGPTGGAGGEAADDGGGGGGAGYYGGGGGEAGEFIAGGGGAGASFVIGAPLAELAKFASAEGASEKVVLSYEGGPAVGAPSVAIEEPASGEVYEIGQEVKTKFSCKESENGPGLSSCRDSNGSESDVGKLKTEHGGEFTYSVTAISKSGKTATKSITYRVAAPPQVHISPASGGFYLVGEKVKTTFSCTEGAGGTTLLSCEDSNGSKTGSGELNTSTVGVGEYTVTAMSNDGQETKLTITYTVLKGEKLAVFKETGSCGSWTVPAGVITPYEAAVVAEPGKPGQAGNAAAPGAGGLGGEVRGEISAATGRSLEVCVGVLGGEGGANAAGSQFAAGGAGGGLSGVFGLPSRSEPLVVAGGGGGGAGSSSVPGGQGGEADERGEAGWILEGLTALPSLGGAGGKVGGNGGKQAGGNGQESLSEFSSAGGGGGGGYRGGGGGGSSATGGTVEEASGGGGAGGEDYCEGGCVQELAPSSQKTAVAIAYDVAPAPVVTVTSPLNGATYVVGETLFAEYECEEKGGSSLKPGSEGCFAVNGAGTKVADGAGLSTAHSGSFSLRVTAVSEDGLTKTETVKYKVAAKPTATFSGVTANKIYAEHAVVHVSAQCSEGASGPGLEKCYDSRAVGQTVTHLGVDKVTFTDTLETETPGKYRYELFATSYDTGEGTKAVSYVVAAAPEAIIASPPGGKPTGSNRSCTRASPAKKGKKAAAFPPARTRTV